MILVVSFGTGNFDARKNDIEGIEKAIEKQFPGHDVHRCFTSRMVIQIIEQREGIHMDSLQEALEKAVQNEITQMMIQPTHVLAGIEYRKIIDVVNTFQDRFEKLCVGLPLLSSKQDYTDLSYAIFGHTKEFIDGRTAVVLVGHGTKVEADNVYHQLQQVLKKEKLYDYYVGTIESNPTKEDIVRTLLQKQRYYQVVLVPLMVVVGNHVANDIFGTESSWKRTLEDAGFKVHEVMKGLGEYPEVQDIYVKHLKEACNLMH